MYLSKHKSGYYYDTLNDKRSSISTKSKIKAIALDFLTDFKKQIRSRQKVGVLPITLEKFIWQYLVYSSSIHTEKTIKAYKVTFNHLRNYFGDITLS